MASQKLTPRQKMINMMYLVLTALLALNVSQETLDVIAKVETSLNQTIENFVAQNNMTYADFSQAHIVNPTKVGPFKEKADQLKENSQALIDKINGYKWDIVREADGEDRARLDSIISMEDMNAPAYIMLSEKPIDHENKKISRATDLRYAINEYREFLLSIVDPNDSVLVHNIMTGLEIVDPPRTRDESNRTWEQENFEYLPLIGVITLMSKMQSDVRNAESDVLNYLFSGIDEESFKFNDLMPVVIPQTSTMVVEGNPYEAKILLAAVDTTQDPTISVNGRQISVENGMGIWKTVPTRAGHFKWGGLLKYKAPDGRTLTYPFEDEYDVIPPIFTVSPTKMNVFYEGLANPIDVTTPGATPGSTRVTVTNATLKKVNEFSYEVTPTQNYGESVVTVTADFNGETRRYPPKRFRLKRVPPPLAMVAGKNGGNIEKSQLTIQRGLKAEQDDFLFDLKYTITRFTVVVTKGEFTDDKVSTSQFFTEEQQRLLSGLRKNDRFSIEDIYAEGPNGKEIPLSNIVFKIQ